MSQQYPQQPQQPGYGYPQQPYGQAPFQPQPPKKRKTGKILGITGAVFVGLIVIGAIAGGGNDSTDTSSKDKAVVATSDKPKAEEPAAKPAKEEPKEQPAADKSQAEQFKACVAKSGTPAEKKAVGHVTKVTGTDKNNDILDSAEVFTDFTGGFMSSNNGDAKLIASAFASCYESENGLVTVYGSDGDMISNGKY